MCQASKGPAGWEADPEQITPGDFLGGPRGLDSTTPGGWGGVSEGSSQSWFRSTVNERHMGALEQGAS